LRGFIDIYEWMGHKTVSFKRIFTIVWRHRKRLAGRCLPIKERVSIEESPPEADGIKSVYREIDLMHTI
jgi:hypothetical protein